MTATTMTPLATDRHWRVVRLISVALIVVGSALGMPSRQLLPLPIPGSTHELAVALAAPVLLVDLRRRGPATLPAPFWWLGAAGILLSGASVLWANSRASAIDFTVYMAEAVFACYLTVALLRGETARTVVRVVVGFVLGLVIVCLLMYAGVAAFQPPADLNPATGDYLSYFSRFSHPFIGRSNNLAALLIALIVPLGVYGIRRRDPWAAGGALLTIAAAAATLSRGNGAALILAFLCYCVLERRRVWQVLKWSPLGALAALTGVGLLYALSRTAQRYIGTRTSSTNVTSRGSLIEAGVSAGQDSILLGQGAGNATHVHNTYVQQVIDLGLVGGLVINVLLVGMVIWWFRRRGDGLWLRTAIGCGVLAQALSFAVESSFDGKLLRSIIWFEWGLLLAWHAAFGNGRAQGQASSDSIPGSPW